MEAVVAIVGLVGLVGLVVLVASVAHCFSDDNDVVDNSHKAHPEPSKPQNPKPAQTEHAPFDAQTSVPTAKVSVIEGAAYIIDGDSLVINKTQIRLFGVDAPELNHPYGKKAKWALLELCRGRTVRAEINHIDAHGRTVAKCYLQDGTDLSSEMVKIGLAIDWPKYSGGCYRSLEVADARKKMWLADARQKGRMHVWEKFEAQSPAK